MSDELVIIEKSGGIATLTLNRPQVLNALSRALMTSLADAFEDIERDTEIGVVIITGAGRAFSAGVDLKELSSNVGQPDVTEDDSGIERLKRGMSECDRPIIGAINGVAITGGFELALACDILIASTDASFADTHARVGIIPGWGMSQKLPRLIGVARAKELSFTGNYISAEQAMEWGLVNRVVSPDELLPACRAMGKDMLSCAPGIIGKYKRLIDDGYGMTLSEGIELESKRATEFAKGVKADAIDSRRKAVQERGRQQSKD
ncbi:enoyl-CoA hydratase [Thermodesulfobacteriota bacterium]